MRVAFVQYGRGNSDLAAMMVHSCKALGYDVTQLSCMEAPTVFGVDRVERAPFDCGRMLFRARLLTKMITPFVLLDTDMIVRKDISDGFGEDAAVTYRDKHLVLSKDEKEPLRMPYNGGVIFASNQGFLVDCLKAMETMEPKRQDWYGDQLALRDVIESGKYKVRIHKDERWNFCPDSEGHDLDNVRIYHYKGNRKRLMPNAFKRMFP